MECLEIQRNNFDSAVGQHQKARTIMDLVLLSLYIQLPPTRCLEIRTLRLWEQQTKPFDSTLVKNNQWNVLLLLENAQITLYFHTYKTKKSRGSDITQIQVYNIHLTKWQLLIIQSEVIICIAGLGTCCDIMLLTALQLKSWDITCFLFFVHFRQTLNWLGYLESI